MLSLQPQYYDELCRGLKKTEYRRGMFIKEPCHGFIYCSTPVAEIGAYVRFGQPIIGSHDEIARIKECEEAGTYDMMLEWLTGSNQATAIPILEVKTFPAISLQELRERFGKFHPPQKYTYIDTRPELLKYLKEVSELDFESA